MDAFGAEPQRVADAAQNECPLGFLFLCVVQMAAAAMRLTGRVQSWAESVEKLMKDLPFYLVSASQWPIYPVLGMLSAMFQRPEYSRALGRQFHGEVHRWGGTHPVAKRFRAFGDLRLLPEELMPFGFDETAETQVEILAAASPYEWLIGMADASQVLKMRPIFRTVLDIIMQLVRASQRHQLRECGFFPHFTRQVQSERLFLECRCSPCVPAAAAEEKGCPHYFHVGAALVPLDSCLCGMDAQTAHTNFGGGDGAGMSGSM